MTGMARRLLDHVHVDPPQRNPAKCWVWHNLIQLEPRRRLPGQCALLVILRDERLHSLVRHDSKIAIRFLDPPQLRKIIRGDLGKSVLEPAHLYPTEMLDQAGKRRRRRDEPTTCILFRQTTELGFDGLTVVVEERLERCAFVRYGGDFAGIEDICHRPKLAPSSRRVTSVKMAPFQLWKD